MKKQLTFFALAIGGMVPSLSVMACSPNMANYGNCIRQQQQAHQQIMQQAHMQQSGYYGQPTRPQRTENTPPPQVTTNQCQARPQGGKACLTVYKQDPDYKFHLIETNAQGNTVYARFYHTDGQAIKSEQWYNAQGIKHGAFKSYHPNGRQKSLGNFVNGQLQGDFKIHDENGQLITVEHYKNDNGVLETHYQNDKKHGQETEFDYIQTKKGHTQIITRTAQWVGGVKHGEEKFFETNNRGKTKLIRTVMWQNGKVVHWWLMNMV